MRALIIAWAATGVVLVSLATWLSLSYDARDYSQQTAQIPTTNELTSTDEVETVTADSGLNVELEPETTPNEVASNTTTTQTQEETGFAIDNTVTRPNFGNENPDEAQNSFSDIVEDESTNTLSFIMSPDPSLQEQGPYGPIPVIQDQRQPWQVYSREFERPGDRPRISIIIVGMGLSERATQNSINQLPPDIALAFSPYGQNLDRWTEEARQNGHETLLMVPMEPLDFPANDPGPHTLMGELTDAENLDRLYYVLSRMQGYVGVVNDMGSKFTADPDAIAPVMQDLQRRGLLFVDARTTRLTVAATSAREFGVPRAQNDRYIDNDVSAAQIDRYLRELENIALRSGNAVGIARPYPITIERLVLWAADLRARGIELAPITALNNRQTIRQ